MKKKVTKTSLSTFFNISNNCDYNIECVYFYIFRESMEIFCNLVYNCTEI